MNAAFPGLVDATVYDMRGEPCLVIGWDDDYLLCVNDDGKIVKLDPYTVTVPVSFTSKDEPS